MIEPHFYFLPICPVTEKQCERLADRLQRARLLDFAARRALKVLRARPQMIRAVPMGAGYISAGGVN